MGTKFKDFLNEQLNDKEFRKEYESLENEYANIQAMIDSEKNYYLMQTA